MGVLAVSAEALYFWRKRVAILEKGADGGALRVRLKLVDLLVRWKNTLESVVVVLLLLVVEAVAPSLLGAIWEATIDPDFWSSFLLLLFFFFLAMVMLLYLRRPAEASWCVGSLDCSLSLSLSLSL